MWQGGRGAPNKHFAALLCTSGRVGQKAGFFKKTQPGGFFWVLLGFIGFYWVLLGFFGFFRVFHFKSILEPILYHIMHFFLFSGISEDKYSSIYKSRCTDFSFFSKNLNYMSLSLSDYQCDSRHLD